MADKNLNTILSALVNNQQHIASKLINGNYKINGVLSASNFILDNGTTLKNIQSISGFTIATGKFEKSTNKLILNRYNDTNAIEVLIDISGGGSIEDQPFYKKFVQNGGTIGGTIYAPNFAINGEYSHSLSALWASYPTTSGLIINSASYKNNQLKLKKYNGDEITVQIAGGSSEPLFNTFVQTGGQIKGIIQAADFTINSRSDYSLKDIWVSYPTTSGLIIKSALYENNYLKLKQYNGNEITAYISGGGGEPLFNNFTSSGGQIKGIIQANDFIINSRSDYSLKDIWASYPATSGLIIKSASYDSNYLRLKQYNGNEITVYISGTGGGSEPLFNNFVSSGGHIGGTIYATNFAIDGEYSHNLSDLWASYPTTSGLIIKSASYENNYLKLKQYNNNEITVYISGTGGGGSTAEKDPYFAAASGKFLVNGNYDQTSDNIKLIKADNSLIQISLSSKLNTITAETLSGLLIVSATYDNNYLKLKQYNNNEITTYIPGGGSSIDEKDPHFANISGNFLVNGNYDTASDNIKLIKANGNLIDISLSSKFNTTDANNLSTKILVQASGYTDTKIQNLGTIFKLIGYADPQNPKILPWQCYTIMPSAGNVYLTDVTLQLGSSFIDETAEFLFVSGRYNVASAYQKLGTASISSGYATVAYVKSAYYDKWNTSSNIQLYNKFQNYYNKDLTSSAEDLQNKFKNYYTTTDIQSLSSILSSAAAASAATAEKNAKDYADIRVASIGTIFKLIGYPDPATPSAFPWDVQTLIPAIGNIYLTDIIHEDEGIKEVAEYLFISGTTNIKENYQKLGNASISTGYATTNYVETISASLGTDLHTNYYKKTETSSATELKNNFNNYYTKDIIENLSGILSGAAEAYTTTQLNNYYNKEDIQTISSNLSGVAKAYTDNILTGYYTATDTRIAIVSSIEYVENNILSAYLKKQQALTGYYTQKDIQTLSSTLSSAAKAYTDETTVHKKIINTQLSGNTARELTVNINKNTDYYFGLISKLTISAIEKSQLQTNLYFTTSNNFDTIEFPVNTKFIGDIIFEDNKEYIMNISNNIVVLGQITQN